jgi:ribosomal protein S18 acetylase RimI-like enzyme
MKKLLYILILSNVFLLGSEHDAKYQYTKNTCNRTDGSRNLSTDKEREEYSGCKDSRFVVYDKVVKKHIAYITYDPSECYISFLRVDEEYRKKGIGAELANRAIKDMRANYSCGDIFLFSTRSGEFWKKLGAEPKDNFKYVFSDPSAGQTSQEKL